MKFKKPHFIASTNIDAQEQKQLLISKYGDFDVNESDVLIVLGGDGFMLQAIKDYMDKKIPFFGINYGSIGFLMNSVADGDLINRLNQAQSVQLSPLVMTAYDKDDSFHTAKAINEVALLRQTHQAAKIQVSIDNQVRLEELICDGILLATPSGSTAYNLSAHGPILSIESNDLALTPISAFRPRRWKGAILNNKSEVKLDILESEKRPVSATADSLEVRNVKSITIRQDTSSKIVLLYDSNHSFEERILNEQFKY
ncbi:NAD kinase [Pelagibacteraceae bacterium]|jgi:NAD+ kinase|nr:NAD kinase [Pelagibacteraceae bacterium]